MGDVDVVWQRVWGRDVPIMHGDMARFQGAECVHVVWQRVWRRQVALHGTAVRGEGVGCINVVRHTV